MAKYLDSAGLTYLWGKIKGNFVSGIQSGTTENHIVVFGKDGYTIKDGGFTVGCNVPADAVFLTKDEHDKLVGIDLGAQVNKIETIQLDGKTIDPDPSGSTNINIVLTDKYVQQEAGKGLSSNDYLNGDKIKLGNIEEGAQVNVLEGVKINDTELDIDEEKHVNIKTGYGLNVLSRDTIGTALKDYTKLTSSTTATGGTVYAVGLDASGNLAVKVPIPNINVNGVKGGEKVIDLDETGMLSSTLGVKIEKPLSGANSGKTLIVLTGIDGAEVASVDASQFVVDGMVDSVAWKKDKETQKETNTLVVTWNTAAGKTATEIDFAKFIDNYVGGNGISVDGGTISVATSNEGNVAFGFDSNKKLKASIELSGKTDIVTGATGMLAQFNAKGQLESSGKLADDLATTSALTTHTSNGDIHVTGTKKTDWDNKLAGVTFNGTAATISGATESKFAVINAVTSVTPGDGLLNGTGTTAITETGTLNVAIKDYKKNTESATKSTDAAKGGLYAVELDKDGKLAVRVPWTDSKNNRALTVTNKEATTNTGTTLTYVESVSGCTSTQGDLTASTTRKTVTIPTVNNETLSIGAKATSASTAVVATTFSANSSDSKTLDIVGGDGITISTTANSGEIKIAADIQGLSNTEIDAAIAAAN